MNRGKDMTNFKSIGSFSDIFGQQEVLESIDENIILADKNCHGQWANPAAANFLDKIAKLYGQESKEDFIGANMSRFHNQPEKQENIMKNLNTTHKAVIQFKDTYSAEIIVNPIRCSEGEIVGYSILLMDVTDKLKVQVEQKKLIQDLSVPILKIWDSVIGVALKGALNEERHHVLTEELMNACVNYKARYVLLDLSGIEVKGEHMVSQLNHLQQALKLVGTMPITVGISPKLALALVKTEVDWLSFSTMEQGIRHILNIENLFIGKR